MKHYLSNRVKDALNNNKPVLAMESTILSSGMPYPQNLDFFHKTEKLCYENGVVPATIAIIEGTIHVGLDQKEAKHITKSKNIKKVSKREIGLCLQKKHSGATTVSSTSHIAHNLGIKVFSTGGIGGVHRDHNDTLDVSQDLYSLRNTPIIVVSSGVKSFLDVKKTVEALETMGVPTIGYNTNHFPLFYFSKSNIKLQYSTTNPTEVVEIYRNNLKCGLNSSLLVLNPVPKSKEIPKKTIEKIISKSIKKMKDENIVGKKTTPYLLNNIAKETKNKSLETNISLALNNVLVGAKIAKNL